MNELDLAYIAGFFDGEGCATIRLVKNSAGNRTPRLEAKIAQNDRAVLDWIKESYGFGNVYAKNDPRTVNVNHWYVVTYKSARLFLTSIEPYLRVKKAWVTELLDKSVEKRYYKFVPEFVSFRWENQN